MEAALSAFEAASTELDAARSTVARCHEQLHKEVSRSLVQLDEWREWRRVMAEHATAAKERVTLNVGGKLFCTSKATLLAHEGTFFFHMLSSGAWQPDEAGQYFIDRSPRQFEHVLDFLRGQLEPDRLEELAPACLHQLRAEVDFYQLDELRDILQRGDWALCPASVAPNVTLPPHPFGASASPGFGFGPTSGTTPTGPSMPGTPGVLFPPAPGHSTSSPSMGFSFMPRPSGQDTPSHSERWTTGDPLFGLYNRLASATRERQFHLAVSTAPFTGTLRWEVLLIAFRDRTKVKLGVTSRKPVARSPIADQPETGYTVMDLLGQITRPMHGGTVFGPLNNSEAQPGDKVGFLLQAENPGVGHPTLSFEYGGRWSDPVPLEGVGPYYVVVQLGECPDTVQVLRFPAAARPGAHSQAPPPAAPLPPTAAAAPLP